MTLPVLPATNVFPRDVVRNMIATLTGFHVGTVRWTNEAEGFIGPIVGKRLGKVTLNLIARQALGQDETRRTYNATTGLLDEETGGQRMSTISIRVESHDSNLPANDILEELRIRLSFFDNIETLERSDLAYSDASNITIIPNFSIDNREVSVASMDLFLGHTVSLAATVGRSYINDISPTTDPALDVTFTKVP